MKDLLEAGVHFGHQTQRWNPKMDKFIYGAKSGIHILDLRITYDAIEQAQEYVQKLVANSGKVLFVGTKPQAQQVIEDQAIRAGMPYVNFRWLGGMLTNFKTIINISSGAAIKNISSWSTYCASKSAIDMLSKVLHEENYKNLRVYSLYPGIIDTKMQYKIRTSSKKDFPLVDSFKDYYMNGELESAENVAKKVFHVMEYPKKYKEIVFSTRDVDLN